MRGHWNPCFSRHFNDWELDIIKTFFFRSLVKLVRREENNGVVWEDSTKDMF